MCAWGVGGCWQSSDKDPVRVSTILQLFLRYLEPNMDLETKASALQACGFVLIAQPQLVLSEPRIDAAMMESLQPTAPQVGLRQRQFIGSGKMCVGGCVKVHLFQSQGLWFACGMRTECTYTSQGSFLVK